MAVSVRTVTYTTKSGKALASLVAAGIGCAVLGLITVLAEHSTGLRALLTFASGVGPLSGKTSVAVVLWLIAWYLLYRRFQTNPPTWTSGLVATWVLIGVGFLGTFYPALLGVFGAH